MVIPLQSLENPKNPKNPKEIPKIQMYTIFHKNDTDLFLPRYSYKIRVLSFKTFLDDP